MSPFLDLGRIGFSLNEGNKAILFLAMAIRLNIADKVYLECTSDRLPGRQLSDGEGFLVYGIDKQFVDQKSQAEL